LNSNELYHLYKHCKTRDALDLWLQTFLKITVPRAPLCPNHSAPFDYLWRAYREPATDLVVWAPRGGGKTRLAAAATLLDLLHKPAISVRILGGSLEQSLRMWDHLLPDVQRLNVGMRNGLHNMRRLATANHSTAAVLTQSQRAVRGLRVQKLRCDEVEMFRSDVWSAAQLTTRSRKCGDLDVRATIEALSTCHRPAGLMIDLIDKARKARTLIKWCLMDVLEKCPDDRPCDSCPLLAECQRRAKHATGFFKIDDAIAMKHRVSKETWENEMLCLRPSTKGAVFPYFDDPIHVHESLSPPLASSRSIWLGIDFGFNDPFVCLWIWRDETDRVFVIDEYVQSGRTMDEHVEEIGRRKQWGTVDHIACDPAGKSRNDQTARSNVDLLKREGYKVHTKDGAKIVDGVEMIRSAVMSGANKSRLTIHPRCVRLIEAMKGYHYPEKGGEQPMKDGRHDHLIDALRYYFINFTRGDATKSAAY